MSTSTQAERHAQDAAHNDRYRANRDKGLVIAINRRIWEEKMRSHARDHNAQTAQSKGEA